MDRRNIPLYSRPGDVVLIVFFLTNLLFITYMVDLEQLVIPDPAHFTYPIWPPRPIIDAVHWWGQTYDPVLIARPPWWKTTIWIDALFFGPFYLLAVYSFWKGKEWIRIPSIIYSSVLITNVLIILSEERYGAHATLHWPVVLLANLPWLIFPVYILYRMSRSSHPFTRPISKGEGNDAF